MGENGRVESDDVSVSEIVRIFETSGGPAIAGNSKDKFSIRFERNDGKLCGQTRAKETAFDIAGQVAARIDREIERADVINPVIKAKGSGEPPVLVG
jgi:hypothetical protein